MAFHRWGEDFDWKSLDEAINFMYKYFKFWRINCSQVKEKFGCLRAYVTLGWSCLLNITHPGHGCYRYPKWLVTLDIYYLSKIIPLLNFIVVPIHKWTYRRAYKLMVKKYPHIKEEILCCADFPELLKGL